MVGTKIREIPQFMGRLKQLQYLPKVCLGKQSGSSIKELGKLCYLAGTLSISQLENIDNVMDAREANMRDKSCLDKLELEWSENHRDSQNERSVLEAVQPHFNLKELTVKNYGGTRFVDWFDSPYFPNLVTLELSKCKHCYCLPPLGQLPSLKKLSIFGFEAIQVIGSEFYGSKLSCVTFKSLEYLELEDMREWKEWMHCEGEGECFPCLEHLFLSSCPKLRNSLPPYLASLKTLSIRECQQLEPSLPKSGVEECWLEQILVTCPNLEELYLNNCPKLVSFPTCQLSAPKLQSLTIIDGSYQLATIHSLWFRSCPCLSSLQLQNCVMLESFQNGGLPPSLIFLSIKQCPKLMDSCKEWGLHQLHSLQEFRISDNFENVECFPEEALLPPNLTDLAFEDCPNLKAVNYKAFLHLTALRSLTISNCPSLQCLPEQPLLNSLQLRISGNCPLLMQQHQNQNEQQTCSSYGPILSTKCKPFGTKQS